MVFSQDISLPKPQNTKEVSLYEALMMRKSSRSFSSKKLTEQQLSDVLWAANGVNREDGKRTAPSARNCQEIDIYVYTSDAVYLYDANANMLRFVLKGDYRKEVAMQPFVSDAPILLMFVANYDKMKGMDDEAKAFYGATDAGYVSQNVYLHCAATKMATVVLGSIHRDKIKNMLKFNGKAILGQPIGFEK